MTKLWYEIKKRLGNAEIDDYCGLCRNSLTLLEARGIKKNEVLIIAPSVNCSGRITHYHIGTALRKNVIGSKIYKDLEEDKND